MNNLRPKLLFNNPVFHAGINLTVRRGTKWDGIKEAYIEDVGIREIKTRSFRFFDLDDTDLKNEHDASCRDYQGLLKEMRQVYPGFSENEIVTLVEFEF
jgi:hypothetical protein